MKLTILTIVTLVIQLGIALLPMFGKLSDETKPLTKRLTTLGKVIASLSIVALILTITQNIITKQEDDEKDNLRQNELLSLRKTLKDSTKLTVIKGFDPSVTLEEYKIDSIKNGKIYGSYMIFCRYAKATKISLSLETIYVENRDSDYLPEFHTLLNFFPEAMTNKAVLEQDQGMERSFSYDSFPSTCNQIILHLNGSYYNADGSKKIPVDDRVMVYDVRTREMRIPTPGEAEKRVRNELAF